MADPLDHVREALVISPGDTLVVCIQPNVTAQQADQMKAFLEEQMPGVRTVVLGVQQIAVHKPEAVAP